MRSVLRQKQQLVHRAKMQGVLSHPRARKIRQLQKSLRRTDARHKCLLSLKAKRNHAEEQLFWIAAAMQRLGSSPNRNSYVFSSHDQVPNLASDDEPGLMPIVMEAIVHIYINRNDQELRELKAKRQPPRGEIRKIEIQKEKELNEFQNGNGFLVPPFASRSEIQLTLEWMEAVMEYEEASISGKLDTNLTEEEKKMLAKQMPKLPPAFSLRVSLKTSKKGNISPTDDFLQLVEQLKNQDGIGNHLLSEDEQEQQDHQQRNNGGGQNDDGDDDEIMDDFDMCADLAERKKKRRRFGTIRKVSAEEDTTSGSSNNNNNSNNNTNAKAINVQGMALDGMARRFNTDRADREKRRKDAMARARQEDDSD